MIQVRELTKRYDGIHAVDSVTFNVEPGELFALLGPNGAGKTTTLNCLLGFADPDSGTATIAGADVVTRRNEARRHVAYIPEQVNLYGAFTGLENLRYFSELSGHRRDDAGLRELLNDAGLQAAAHTRRLSTYSKGMRQKVGIAIALAKGARALLLDEPTSGLDPAASHEFSAVLTQLRERGVAILMATHDLFRAREDATHIGIMRHGRIVRTLPAAEFRHADLEALYLSAMHEPADVRLQARKSL
jgi:ABC-2 type transport system ATP-binding protein